MTAMATPHLRCRLLSGASARWWLEEGMVRVEDLQRVNGLAYTNSLRRWLTADVA